MYACMCLLSTTQNTRRDEYNSGIGEMLNIVTRWSDPHATHTSIPHFGVSSETQRHDRGMLMPRESISESRMWRRRPAHHRKQDKEAAIDYDTRKTESLQNAARAKTVTFGLLCKPLEAASEGGAASEGTRAVAVQVLTDVPADGSLRLVPAPNGNPLRDREYIRVEDILGGTLADEKPRRKQEYFDSYSCLDWQATMHAEEKKRVRIARAATPS